MDDKLVFSQVAVILDTISFTKSAVVAFPPRSVVAHPSSRASLIAFSIATAAVFSPIWRSIIEADKIILMGLTMPCPAISGALPCEASNSACFSPIFAEPSNPSDPTRPPAKSLIISPQQLGATSTSYLNESLRAHTVSRDDSEL